MMREAYRAQQVTIDVIKPDTPPMVSLLIQRLELDENDNITAITSQRDRIYRNAAKIPTETVQFTDPVTGLSGEMSIAGLDQVLRLFANRWTAEEYACETGVNGWAVNCQNAG